MNTSPILILILIVCFYSTDVSSANDTCDGSSGAQYDKNRASSIALEAAKEAKAAQEAQQSVGQQALLQAKEQLAQKALQAANAAEAAVAGKETIIHQIEEEIHGAREVEDEEARSLRQGKVFLKAALEAAHQSNIEVKLLTNALQIAEANAVNAKQTQNGAQKEVNEEQQLLKGATRRRDDVEKKLKSAKVDLQSTKNAVEETAESADLAKENVLRSRRKTKKAQINV